MAGFARIVSKVYVDNSLLVLPLSIYTYLAITMSCQIFVDSRGNHCVACRVDSKSGALHYKLKPN